MDIFVNTEALDVGVDSISYTVDTLLACVDAMKMCLSSAGNDFDTINYGRASVSVGVATAALNQMEANLDAARKYLQTLIEHITKYDSLRF